MPSEYVIQTNALQKTFTSKERGTKKTVQAVRGINLAVKRGEIFGFLGPNGAGKSTTQKMLSTLMQPSGGEAKVLGYDLVKEQVQIRKNVGFVSQAGGADLAASGLANLVLQARLFGMSASEAKAAAKEFAERFQMTSFIDRPVGTYSGGQKRRLDIALGMIHRPQLLLLDEPTTGLDPQSRAYLWEEIEKLKTDGVTIFLTTQYMDEADKLCDTIAIMDHGQIIKAGTPEQLKDSVGGDTIILTFNSHETAKKAEALLTEHVAFERIKTNDTSVHLTIKNGERTMPDLLRLMDGCNLQVQGVMLSRPSLDDVFLKYTGRSLREEAKA
ncbi:MAG: ATP-binding cassette domain-containing protein [Methanocella sp.]|jgi:ABC-2 type transport system ATP-binding protein